MIEGIGATKSEIIDAIHAGANQADIVRLEGAVWRLFDQVSGLKHMICEAQRLREALAEIARHDNTGITGPGRQQADSCVQIARAALKEATDV